MLIKICGITNLDDAMAAADAGASAIGFNFYSGSPRYLRPDIAGEISGKLSETICKVGVFVNETPARVVEVSRIARLDVIQLHGSESPETAALSARVWKAFRMDSNFSEDVLETYGCEAFVLDAPGNGEWGGSGRTWDWTRAVTGRRIVLAGGLDAGNVRAAIEAAQPWGVDACSRLERAPGLKDHEKMRKFIRAAGAR